MGNVLVLYPYQVASIPLFRFVGVKGDGLIHKLDQLHISSNYCINRQQKLLRVTKFRTTGLVQNRIRSAVVGVHV